MPSPNIKSNVQRLLSLVTKSGGIVGVWGCVIIAIASGWVALPTSLAITFATALGGNLMASIVERIGRGEPIKDEEIIEALRDPNQGAAIERLISNNLLGAETTAQIRSATFEIGTLAELVKTEFQTTRDQSTLEHQQLSDQLTVVEARISTLITSQFAGSTGVAPRDIAVNAKLDIVANLINCVDGTGALNVLDSFAAEIVPETASNIRARYATAKAAAAEQVGDITLLTEEVEKAYILNPSDPDIVANAAAGAALRGDWDKALELSSKARGMTPTCGSATATYMEALHKFGRDQEIKTLVQDEQWISANLECSFVLAQFAIESGERASAIPLLRVASSPSNVLPTKVNPVAYSLLAECLLFPLMEQFNDDPPLPGVPDERVRLLDEPLSLLDLAIDGYKRRSDVRSLGAALANRAAVLARMGRHDDAERDLDEALKQTPDNDIALQNKGQILLKRNDMVAAAQHFEKIADPSRRSATLLQLGVALLGTDIDRAIETFSQGWGSSDPAVAIPAANFLLRAYSTVNNRKASDKVVSRLETDWPTSPDALSTLSYEHARRGSFDRSIETINLAIKLSTSQRQKEWFLRQRADINYGAGRYGEAADDYRKFVRSKSDDPNLGYYLFALHKTKSHGGVMRAIETLRSNGELPQNIHELEAITYQQVGNYRGALESWSELYDKYKQPRYQIAKLASLISLGKYADAKDVGSQVAYDEIKDNPELLMRLAHCQLSLRQPGVMHLALRALRISHYSSDFAGDYLHLTAQCEQLLPNEVAHPEVIGVNTHVALSHSKGTTNYYILPDSPVDPAADEILSDSPVALQLAGKRAGDTFDLAPPSASTRTCTVTSIETVYGAAFRKVGELLESGGIEHPGLFAFTISPNQN